MKEERVRDLLRQYFDNSIAENDCEELLNYLKDTSLDELSLLMEAQHIPLDDGPRFTDLQRRLVFERIKSDSRFYLDNSLRRDISHPKPYKSLWFKVAALLLLISSITLLIISFEHHRNTVLSKVKRPVNVYSEIIPGGKHATLKIGNGKIIDLDHVSVGRLASSGMTAISKSGNGQLTYERISPTGENSSSNQSVEYSTLATPNGGEYKLKLPDGTLAWLNSASSISFPTTFAGHERRVAISGEVYFEVAKNKVKPFIVSAKNFHVKVLGTHFNVQAYSDNDHSFTTLFEGAVHISIGGRGTLLVPGQQAVTQTSSDQIIVSKANTDHALAWTHGYFVFNDEDLGSIMKQVSRWYDVEVQFQGHQTDRRFGGTFHRTKGITELLHHLEKIGNVHFKVSGRRIIVMP